MENPLADLVESQISRSYQRLLFVEQCAFHAALMCGVRNDAVAVATGLSSTAIAHLKQAGQSLGGQIRYPAVARERRNLGDEAFKQKYITPKIRDRLQVAMEQIRLKQTTPKPPGAIRPHATRFAGHHEVKTGWNGDWAFSVRLSTTPPVGWLFGVTLEPGRGQIKPEHVRWSGDPSRDGRGYATSTEAYSAIMAQINPKD